MFDVVVLDIQCDIEADAIDGPEYADRTHAGCDPNAVELGGCRNSLGNNGQGFTLYGSPYPVDDEADAFLARDGGDESVFGQFSPEDVENPFIGVSVGDQLGLRGLGRLPVVGVEKPLRMLDLADELAAHEGRRVGADDRVRCGDFVQLAQHIDLERLHLGNRFDYIPSIFHCAGQVGEVLDGRGLSAQGGASLDQFRDPLIKEFLCGL